MVSADQPPDIQAKILAGRLLTVGARHASEGLNHFSAWLLAGFGATFALLIANIEEVSEHLAPGSLRHALWLFLVALLLGTGAKLLAAIVGAAGAAASESEVIGRQLAAENVELNFKTVFRETEKATFWPMRVSVAALLRKAELGDLAAGGRLHARLAQIQSILILGEVVAAAASALVLACGLGS